MVCYGTILAQALNGIYEGEVCELSEADIVYYDDTPLRIIVDKPLKFLGGQILSNNNENNEHRISLKVERLPLGTWLILKVDASYYASRVRKKKKRRYYDSSKKKKPLIDKEKQVAKDTFNGIISFTTKKREDAERISELLNVEIIDRKHFGHKLNWELKPRKTSYTLGDSILLDFTVMNEGQIPVELSWDNWQRGSTSISHRFLFTAVHKGDTLKNKKERDPNAAIFISGPASPRNVLQATNQLQRKIDLDQWFDFEEPGEYLISWSFRKTLKDVRKPYNKKRYPEFNWDEEVAGSFVLRIE